MIDNQRNTLTKISKKEFKYYNEMLSTAVFPEQREYVISLIQSNNFIKCELYNTLINSTCWLFTPEYNQN